MTPLEYQNDVERTALHPVNMELDKAEHDLLHFGLGISTEAGELLDALKKSWFYGKPLDLVNIREELGDLLWYIAALHQRMGWDMELTMEANIAKLRKRYPEKFTKADALNRDLEAERDQLELDLT